MKQILKKAIPFALVFTLFATTLSLPAAAQAPARLPNEGGEVLVTILRQGQEFSVFGTPEIKLEAMTKAAIQLSLEDKAASRIAVCCSAATMQLSTTRYEVHANQANGYCTVEYGNLVICAHCGYLHSQAFGGYDSHRHSSCTVPLADFVKNRA